VIERADIKLVLDQLNSLELDEYDTCTIDAAITMLEDCGNEVAWLRKTIKQADEDTATLRAKGQRIAWLLEAICVSSDFDNAATSKYWDEAMTAIEEWRT